MAPTSARWPRRARFLADEVTYYDWSGGGAPVGAQARRRRRGRSPRGGRFLVAYPLEDEDQDGPRRELRLGPDRAGNLLEIVVLLLDDGDELVIHAMRMRPKCRDLLP